MIFNFKGKESCRYAVDSPYIKIPLEYLPENGKYNPFGPDLMFRDELAGHAYFHRSIGLQIGKMILSNGFPLRYDYYPETAEAPWLGKAAMAEGMAPGWLGLVEHWPIFKEYISRVRETVVEFAAAYHASGKPIPGNREDRFTITYVTEKELLEKYPDVLFVSGYLAHDSRGRLRRDEILVNVYDDMPIIETEHARCKVFFRTRSNCLDVYIVDLSSDKSMDWGKLQRFINPDLTTIEIDDADKVFGYDDYDSNVALASLALLIRVYIDGEKQRKHNEQHMGYPERKEYGASIIDSSLHLMGQHLSISHRDMLDAEKIDIHVVRDLEYTYGQIIYLIRTKGLVPKYILDELERLPLMSDRIYKRVDK